MDRKISKKIIKSPLLWIGIVLIVLINTLSYHKEQQVEKEAEKKVNMMVQNMSINNINTFKGILFDYIKKLEEIGRIYTDKDFDINRSLNHLIEEDSIYSITEIIDTAIDAYKLEPVLLTNRPYLQIIVPFSETSTNKKAFSLKIPLYELHKKVAQNESLSYAYLTLSHNNIYVYHPDEQMIGLKCPPITEQKNDSVVEKTVLKTFSDYLDIPVYTYFEKVTIGDSEWTISANVPDISFNELVTNIRKGFIYMALSASLAFGFILFLGIFFWKKEFMRRQQVEKDKIKLELKNELQKQQVLATELEQLKSGLNPHFLFNSLSSLKVLVSKKPEEAKKFAIALSNLYRYLLKQQNTHLTTLEEELKFSKDYIYLQQIRFSNRIKTTIDIDSSALSQQLPPMSLQLLIENCIKHTTMTESKPLMIEIYTSSNYLFVTNNYNPPTHTLSTGIGLENLTKRYAHITDLPCSFIREGSRFVAKIPLL